MSTTQYRFFERIAKEYKAASAHTFMLHYNVHDLLWDQRYGYLPTQYFLMEQLNVIGCDIVLGYTPSQGIVWPYVDRWREVQRALSLEARQTEWDGNPPDPVEPIGQFQADGTFIADQLGLVRIRAKAESSQGEIYSQPTTVRVGDTKRQIHRLEILPTNKRTIQAGKRFRFQVIGYDRSGRRVGIQHARWWVEGGIGRISGEGVFTAGKIGTGRIWVQVRDVRAQTEEITISHGLPVEIQVDVPRHPIGARQPHRFAVSGRDADGNPLKMGNRAVEFEVIPPTEDNPAYHPINQHGYSQDKVHEDPLISGRLPPGKDLRDKLETVFNQDRFKVGLVIYHLEKIAPNTDRLTLDGERQLFLDALQQWTTDLDMRLKKHIILMATQNITEVHPILSKNIDIPVVEIPFPSYSERIKLVQHLEDLSQLTDGGQQDQIRRQVKLAPDYSHDQLARDTSGLNLFGVHDITLRAEEEEPSISPDLVTEYRRSSVDVHTRGILEVISTPHDLSVVGGMPHVGEILEDIIGAIHEKDLRRVPRGLLLLGPSGTGKTMVAQMIARYSDLPFLRLKNPREWTGIESATASNVQLYEKNLSMALNFILGMLPAIVFIDEIDQAAGPRTQIGGSQNFDSMLPTELLNLMNDTSKHGEILWIGASNRPDLIDSAFRRRGLFEDKIILLRPTDGQRADILQKMYKKHHIAYQDLDFKEMDKATRKMTGGDIEQIVRRSYIFAKREGHEVVTDHDLRRAVTDFVPQYSDQVNEAMGLLALREATSRSMIPPQLPYELREYIVEEADYNRWRIDKSRINQRLKELGEIFSF